MTLKPEDVALIERVKSLCNDWANGENLVITGNVIEDVEDVIELAEHPDPRPSPVGREEVARWICRTVRIAQGFKGTAEYTLDDEVHNAWDDWLDEADDLLALFSPADGWRLVPTDPDGAMKMAGCAAPRSDATRAATNTLARQMETVADIYRAMLAAAPPPPGGQG